MAETSVDVLARSLATAMPRRRALRLLGSALALAALPAGRATPGEAARAARPITGPGRAARVVPPTGPFGEPVPCGDVVCNPTYNCVKCCMQSTGQPGSCCPCYSNCSPTGSGLCAEAFACPPDARPYCGKHGVCCAPNEFCFKGSICVPICEKGEERCDEDCCAKGFECVNAKVPGQPLRRQCFPKCPGGRVRCGLGCCERRNEKCIDARVALCAQCEPGHQPCGKKCCPKGTSCCDSKKRLCCKRGSETCAGFGGTAKCCPKGTSACEDAPGSGKATCCKKGEVCAQIADPSGTVPAALLRKFECCPAERTVAFGPGTNTCCPEGYRSLGGRFILPPFGGGGLCCREDKVCGETCCSSNSDPGLDGTCCNGTCVSLYFDAGNCGSCGNVCPPGTRCLQGACQTA
jgi:hypothetical protein